MSTKDMDLNFDGLDDIEVDMDDVNVVDVEPITENVEDIQDAVEPPAEDSFENPVAEQTKKTEKGSVDMNKNVDSFDTDLKQQESIVDQSLVVNDNKATAPATNNFAFDFGSLGVPGIMTGQIGLQVSKYAIDKLKFTKSARTLLNIITSNVICVKTHYIEDVGSVICNEGYCCEVADVPSVRYVFPCVVYDTDKAGKPMSTALEFKSLVVGQGVYQDIMTQHELNEDITNFDLLITCKEETYQDISITPAGACRWKKQPKLVEEVTSFYAKNMKDILKPIGKIMTSKQLKEKLGAGIQTTISEGADLGDVFGE